MSKTIQYLNAFRVRYLNHLFFTTLKKIVITHFIRSQAMDNLGTDIRKELIASQ